VTVIAGFNYYYLTGALAVVFALTISILGLTSSKLSVLLFIAGIVGAAAGAKYKSGERHGPPKGTPVAGHKGG
jgi:hypothetical protein